MKCAARQSWHPKDAEIRSDLGLALARLGRIPEAIDQFHEALRLDPDNAARPMPIWGGPSLHPGNPGRAFRNLRQRCSLNPEFKAAADGLRQAQAQLSPQR